MPLLQFRCPHCHQPIALDATGKCSTALKNGSVCGFSLPIQYEDGNSKYRSKFVKHTTPPASGVSGEYSWVDSSGTYPFCQQSALTDGSLHLDSTSNYLFLWTTPSGNGPLANIYYGSAGSVSSASGVIMPLNSKPQNLHHFYSNYESHFVPVADGTGLVIHAPDDMNPEYRVEKSGALIYKYNPQTKISWP